MKKNANLGKILKIQKHMPIIKTSPPVLGKNNKKRWFTENR